MGAEANEEWIRYYYEQCYKPYEHLIQESDLLRIYSQVAAEQNVASKGIIPRITFFDFMDKIKSKKYTHDEMHDVGGSVIEIPQTTPEDYPVDVFDYMNNVMIMPEMNTNTNLGRMDGMKKILEKDKEQRKEFLEENIISSIEDSIKESKTTDDTIQQTINDQCDITHTEQRDETLTNNENYKTMDDFINNNTIEVNTCVFDGKENYILTTNKGVFVVPQKDMKQQ